MTIRGVDTSSYQNYPNLERVRGAGVIFNWTKLTEGTTYVAPTFTHNWFSSKDNDLLRGAYHFARPGDSEPDIQANWFLDHLPHLYAGDSLILDIETGSGDTSDWCLKWLEQVEKETGVTPWIYTGLFYAAPAGLTDNPKLARFPLWLAKYSATAPTYAPAAPAAWTQIMAVQWTDKARIPGIDGDVDENVFFGTRDDLFALGKKEIKIEIPIMLDLSDVDKARVYSELTIIYLAEERLREILKHPNDVQTLDGLIERVDEIKQRYALTP